MWESEEIFAEYLENQGKSWAYEPIRFQLSIGTYTPDFYCPDNDTFYEVDAGGTMDTKKDKVNLFESEYPHIKFKVISPGGQEIPKVNDRYFLSKPMVDMSWKTKLRKKKKKKEHGWPYLSAQVEPFVKTRIKQEATSMMISSSRLLREIIIGWIQGQDSHNWKKRAVNNLSRRVMPNKTRTQKTKPGPKTNYTKTGIRVVATLPPPLADEVKKTAWSHGVSYQVFIKEALVEYVKKHKV